MDRPIGNTPEVHAECEKWYVISWQLGKNPLSQIVDSTSGHSS